MKINITCNRNLINKQKNVIKKNIQRIILTVKTTPTNKK